MKKQKIAGLEIWNESFYLDAVLSFLDCIVQEHRRRDDRRWKKMRFVLGEMLSERIEKAYPGQKGKILVEASITEGCFEVSIVDEGIPVWEDFSYDEKRLTEDDRAFRNFLLENMVDEVGMEQLGKAGQRIYVRQKLLNALAFNEPEPYPEIEVLDSDISIVPVRTPEQALEAIRCIYDAYGYAYGYERLYFIDSFMSLIAEGSLISFLAVNAHGQVAGHFALSFSNTYRSMPEISTVVIRREFRKLGLFSLFMEHCEKTARELGLRALMGQPVAFHPMSQKACIRAGYTATSLLFSYLDPSMSKDYGSGERMDLFAAVKLVDENAQSRAYMPAGLIPFAKKVYDSLGWRYEFLPCQGPAPHSLFSIDDNSAMKIKQILLSQAGSDIEGILRRSVNDAIRKKTEMIELLICLDSPGAGFAYEAARSCGFIFSGLMPGGEDRDYILMQMLMGSRPRFDRLVSVGIFEELAADIAGLCDNGKENSDEP